MTGCTKFRDGQQHMHLAAAHSLLGCIIRKMRSQLNAEERRSVVLSEVEAVAAGVMQEGMTAKFGLWSGRHITGKQGHNRWRQVRLVIYLEVKHEMAPVPRPAAAAASKGFSTCLSSL